MQNLAAQKYIQALETKPIITKAVTSGILNGLQEIIATGITKTYNKYTIKKALTMAAYGSTIAGPLGHILYKSVEKLFEGKSGNLIGVLKLIYSNLVISPILTFCYLVALGYSAGLSLKKAISVARAKIFNTMKVAWAVNPLIQTFAFQFLDNQTLNDWNLGIHVSFEIFFCLSCLMFRQVRQFVTKVDIKLVAKLRKETDCSMIKAKEVLLKNNNDYQKALLELECQVVNLDKLANRTTQEGLIAIYNHPLGYQSAMVELNCETDFVAKNDAFIQFCQRVVETCGLTVRGTGDAEIKPVELETLRSKDIVGGDGTINEGLAKVIGKVKENISVRRAVISNEVGNYITAGYAHAAGVPLPSGLGRLGSIVAVHFKDNKTLKEGERKELFLLTKQIAQHISGFNPLSINERPNIPKESVLLHQQFLFGGGSIAEVLNQYGSKLDIALEIVDFKRFEVGEGMEKKEDNFAAEVMAQIK